MLLPTDINFAEEIIRLKKERNAVILAHYYQTGDIQDIADFVGDSLELSRKAASTDADVILFAGVHFMAETAKILSPQKTVLIPDLTAGCSLSDDCPPPLFKKFREEHPDHLAITYINCSAAVKAMSDIICTSSNAEKIINQIPKEQKILFSPDRNLGAFLKKKTGRDMLLWEGSCIVHEKFSLKKILDKKSLYPQAKILCHPECEEEILAVADFIGSTSGILKYVQQSHDDIFIIVTEVGILHQMQKSTMGKMFIPAEPDTLCSCNECPHMKKNTIEKVYLALRDNSPQIILSDDIIEKARIPINRMLEMSV